MMNKSEIQTILQENRAIKTKAVRNDHSVIEAAKEEDQQDLAIYVGNELRDFLQRKARSHLFALYFSESVVKANKPRSLDMILELWWNYGAPIPPGFDHITKANPDYIAFQDFLIRGKHKLKDNKYKAWLNKEIPETSSAREDVEFIKYG